MGKRYWNSDDTLDAGIEDQTAFDRALRRRNRRAAETRAATRPPKRERLKGGPNSTTEK